MFFWKKRELSPEAKLKATSLQELFKKMSPSNEESAYAEQWMNNFQSSSREDLSTNSLELDKHIVTVAGGAIVVMVTFLGVIQVGNLTQQWLGLLAIWALVLSIVGVVCSYVAAVHTAKSTLEANDVSSNLTNMMRFTAQKDGTFWDEANKQKNRFCDLIPICRRWNWLIGKCSLGAQILFIVGMICITVFATYNLLELKYMKEGNQFTTQGGEHSRKASELPSTAFDQMVNNTVHSMSGTQAGNPTQNSGGATPPPPSNNPPQ